MLGLASCGGRAEGGSQVSPSVASTSSAQTPVSRRLEPCTYEALAVLCADGSCPSDPAGFEPQCSEDVTVQRATPVCGGTVIVVGSLLGATTWFFDADGNLTGAITSADVVETCPDEHRSSVHVYGTTCPIEEPWQNLCPDAP
jgi:hypothetical protein